MPNWKPLKGGLQNRRIVSSEYFASKCYPMKPQWPDKILYRFAGNMVPISYTSRFIEAAVRYLEAAGCKPDLVPKCDEYAT